MVIFFSSFNNRNSSDYSLDASVPATKYIDGNSQSLFDQRIFKLNGKIIPGGRAKLRQIISSEKHDFKVWKTGPWVVN
jgi:hypothetical protein